ncbi:hypothetical protein, conserved [Leishmania tarentolae]|uniref:Transmembrane protein n=1 Tax=Leishmania tarentolae TaxID=5689 RepID=A0A640KMN1_LEITA|nr:hypothetical protein, conserved [Leishmania tarentolae]
MKVQVIFAMVAALAVLPCCLSSLDAASSEASISTSIPAAAGPLSSLASRARHTAEVALAPIAAKVPPCAPPAVLELAPIFAHGAASLVMVGRGRRTPPPAVNGPRGDDVLQHTTAKFAYATGAIVAELALLKIVHREPYRNQRRNPVNRFFATAAGFFLLVLLTALPNDLVDTSLVCIFYFKLSSQVYMPAVVCGQLVSVYVAALVPALPPLSAAYTAFLACWTDSLIDGLSPAQVREAWAELILALVVLGAFAFFMSARRAAGSAQSSLLELESDGDDYYAE